MTTSTNSLVPPNPHIPNFRPLHILRFGLPLFLFALATGFETWEHTYHGGPLVHDWLGLLEIFVFGMIGPAIVYWTLTYVERMMQDLERTRQETAQLNQNLERLVAERTAALQVSYVELEEANTQLRQLDQMKSDFVSLVSHELRAPLATMNGGFEVVAQHLEHLPARLQRIFHLLGEETGRLTRFVETMLDVSQLEAGKIRPTCGPVAVRPLLGRAAQVTLGLDEARVVWNLPADLPPVWADEIYLEQTVRNLVRNAQKYAPPGTPIELSATVEANTMCICVTDHGPGIPASEQRKVFERFYRAPGQGEKQVGGWGLGLYFARALMTAQQGALDVQSPAHSAPAAPGARFIVTLPLAEEAPVDDDQSQTAAD